jgi:shikimate kinase
MSHIFLTGFMGAGKSTVGLILADILGLDFVDLDQLIVETEGVSINHIFSEEGEHYFRELESSVLKTTIETDTKIVSTGGGCVERDENRKLMKKTGTIVYLDTPWNVIVERLAGSTERPLAAKENNWEKTFTLYEKRIPLYATAGITVLTSGKTPEAIAHEIAGLVRH